MGAKLVELATRMQERKIQLLSQARCAGLKPESIQNPEGGEQSRRKSA